ncbi:MAG: hypothetical protein AB1626_02740 [Candidatus Micrarchaeota archaeon]
MAGEFDIKFQEVKNAIYFLAETLERKYVENNAKIDRLAESIDHLAASLPAGGSAPAGGDAALRDAIDALNKRVSELPAADLKKMSDAAARLSAAVETQAKENAKRDEEIVRQLSALAKTDFAKAADALSRIQAGGPSAVEEKVASLSAQVAELRKQNQVLIEAVNLIVSEVEAAKAGGHGV